MEIDGMLAERGEQYGEFDELAEISQDLKENIGIRNGWDNLTSDQKESLEMICHKIARILNGDPNYIDSWADIAGYAQLIVQRLERAAEDEAEAEAEPQGVSHKKVKKAFRTLMRAGIISSH